MNDYQKLWWQQAQSDHVVFVLLRNQGIADCHSLHYLQMVTEKIAKAHFWRRGSPPPMDHAAFVRFMRYFGQIPRNNRERIADLFTFTRFDDFQAWIRTVLPLAYELERLAPTLAQAGPNPEYPWPHEQPRFAPANEKFPLWAELKYGRGRGLMRFIHTAVDRFPQYADT